VLPGPWEAALGWLSLNYRHGLLPGSPPPATALPADTHQLSSGLATPSDVGRGIAERGNTVAMLDVGGSSVEVAVEAAGEVKSRATRSGPLFVAEVVPTTEASAQEESEPAALSFNVAGAHVPCRLSGPPALVTPAAPADPQELLTAARPPPCLYVTCQYMTRFFLALRLASAFMV
jgi:hypothetical protein